jgi:hypothetical protein
MPEGKDDKATLVPEFLGVLLTKVFLPDGQGEKAENPDVYSGDDLKKNLIFPGPLVHKGFSPKSARRKVFKKAFSEIPPVLHFNGRKVGAGLKPAPTALDAIEDLTFPDGASFAKGCFELSDFRFHASDFDLT